MGGSGRGNHDKLPHPMGESPQCFDNTCTKIWGGRDPKEKYMTDTSSLAPKWLCHQCLPVTGGGEKQSLLPKSLLILSLYNTQCWCFLFFAVRLSQLMYPKLTYPKFRKELWMELWHLKFGGLSYSSVFKIPLMEEKTGLTGWLSLFTIKFASLFLQKEDKNISLPPP